MNAEPLQFSNALGRALAPLLLAIRSTGFFEASAFLPLMTFASVALFLVLYRRLHRNGFFEEGHRIVRYTLALGYFTQCFLVLNAGAVALKSMIVQELDYSEWHWYIPWVSPLHFYIASVATAHLCAIWRSDRAAIDNALCGYVQVGLLGGFYIAAHRLLTEPFEVTDVTTGVGATFMLIWFAVLNWDIVLRLCPRDSSGMSTSEELQFLPPN
ncbi:MAG: hypothetical protein AAGA68_22830 [Pseudomonadota bacterium]